MSEEERAKFESQFKQQPAPAGGAAAAHPGKKDAGKKK
jgi:hypothetical protein